VDATGITLSRNQHAHVNRLIQEKGLEGRVRMHLLDYRKLETNQPYDKIASVGMFEHVGREQLRSYFAQLGRLLRPGGLIMNHGITAGGVNNSQLGAGMGEFIEKYIFPGGELTHIGHVLTALTDAGLEDVDIENLRPHYARTLWAWSDALESQLDAARATLPGEQGERALRAYRMYLAGCAMGFEHGWIALHQAQRDVLIANAYFLPGRRFRLALKRAAMRGVRVRLLLQGRSEYPLQHRATRHLYRKLLAQGVQLYEYMASYLHAKVAVIDDAATVGSSNLDPRSLRLNFELDVENYDRDVAAWIEQRIDAQIAHARRETLTTLQARPFAKQLRDRVIWLATPYL